MTKDRWQRIHEVFQDALEQPAAEQAAYLGEACSGDVELHREVEALLAAFAQPGRFDRLAERFDISEKVSPLLPTMYPQASSLIGEVIDEYRVEELLGQGGMGVVYKAADTQLNRTVALKVIKPELAVSEQFVRRFHTEARALAQIQDPGIVFIYALRATSRGLYIAMEFVEGETLASLIAADSPLSVEEGLPLARQLLQSLAYAHGKGIIHRDIKPGNIMLTPGGSVKIMDFGLAKVAHGSNDSTLTNMRAGSLYYMSPEQVNGLRHVDHRSDLFSLGMTLYQMFSGRLPFEKDSSQLTILKTIAKGKFPPPHTFNTALPRDLAKIIMKALAKAPTKRYQSASEMLAALEAFAERQRLNDRAVDTQRHSRPPKSVGRKRVGTVTAVLVLLMLGVGGYLVLPGLFAPRLTIVDSAAATLMPVDSTVFDPPATSTSSEREEIAADTAGNNLVATQAPTEEVATNEQGEGTEGVTPPMVSSIASSSDNQRNQDVEEGPESIVSTGTLSINSTPPGARILINGALAGDTPTTIPDTPTGRHTIELQLANHQAYTTVVAVSPGQKHAVNASLEPLMGALQVAVNPWGRLYVDGVLKRAQVDFVQQIDVPAGRHTISVEHPQYGRWVQSVVLAADARREIMVDFTLTAPLTVVAVDTDGHPLDRGEILIDDQERGPVPRTIEVPIGLRKIEVRAAGYVLDGAPTVLQVEQNRTAEPVIITLRREE